MKKINPIDAAKLTLAFTAFAALIGVTSAIALSTFAWVWWFIAEIIK